MTYILSIKNTVAAFLFLALFFVNYTAYAGTAPAAKQTTSSQTQVQTVRVTPLALVADPKEFLTKKIIMDGKFDKFSTLGLDYKKAFRDSNSYIGFMIQRDDVADHNVPLSELKLFLKREYAEKFVDLNTGDKISMTGVVFSNALGDAWVDITNIQILQKAPGGDSKK